MAVTKIKPIKSTLSKALDYIENPDKTDGKMLVSSFGCSYETADIEFEYTLTLFSFSASINAFNETNAHCKSSNLGLETNSFSNPQTKPF